jgi:hypothetical protein
VPVRGGEVDVGTPDYDPSHFEVRKEHPDMKALRRLRVSPALVVASLALLVALGDTGWATFQQIRPNSVGTQQLRAGAVTAPKIKTSAVTSNKIRNRTIRRADLAPGTLRPGPPGPAGPAGPAGTVTRLWAIINASGSIARGVGVTSAGRMGLGQYEVIFAGDVQNCVYNVSVGDPTNLTGGTVGYAMAGRRPNNVNGVRVNTRNAQGGAADRNFHLLVVC